MYAGDFPQSPKQVTVTQVWHNTRKPGRDDDEIEAAQRKHAADRRKANRSMKPFSRERLKVHTPNVETEISELTQPEMILQAEVDESSSDSEFVSKLVSPANKKRMHSVMATNEAPNSSSSKIHVDSRMINDRMIQDLNNKILLQNRVIADLRHKLSLIRDISIESNIVDKKNIGSDVERDRKISDVGNMDNEDSATSTIVTGGKDANKIVHIHIN